MKIDSVKLRQWCKEIDEDIGDLRGDSRISADKRRERVIKIVAQHVPGLLDEIDRLNQVVLEQISQANEHLAKLREWMEP